MVSPAAQARRCGTCRAVVRRAFRHASISARLVANRAGGTKGGCFSTDRRLGIPGRTDLFGGCTLPVIRGTGRYHLVPGTGDVSLLRPGDPGDQGPTHEARDAARRGVWPAVRAERTGE